MEDAKTNQAFVRAAAVPVNEIQDLIENGTCNKCNNGDILDSGENYSTVFSCNYHGKVKGCKYFESIL